ncbi:hypothetical protein [Alteribacillus sp. HJP-4]|uniref:hypothetical protein n=1 Tax=Alteribacillus sp. HJP-4 TaxID=2775394 RepID=UPI0035CCE581
MSRKRKISPIYHDYEEVEMNDEITRPGNNSDNDMINEMREKLEEALDQAKNGKCSNAEAKYLKELREYLYNAQQAECPGIVFDQCTIELPRNSIAGGESPPLITAVLNDPFFLRCCTTPTEVDAVTPCGTISNACMVNEVRATGYINYYLSFELDTFLNNGESNCSALNTLPFSCSDTTCVDEILCYTGLDAEESCPDFCNENVLSFGFICSTCNTGNKLTVTYVIVHILPNCDDMENS